MKKILRYFNILIIITTIKLQKPEQIPIDVILNSEQNDKYIE